MEPQVKLQYSVTFNEHDYVFSSDSAEVLASEDEKPPDCEKDSHCPSKMSSVSGIGVDGEGDIHSASSISTSILDDAEEIKSLKNKVTELEARNRLLEYEIEKVNLCLINERAKNSKLEKKLQFVKDNQDVFIKLKEAYINMKYNEAAGRKMIEIREKGLQTWEGILCRGCIDAEQMRRQLQSVRETYKDSYIISPFQLDQILNTLKYLKDLIDRREQTWAFNAERDVKFRMQIQTLESENSTLREVIQCREPNPVDELCVCESVINTDATTFKKIIIKYEKKIREVEKNSNGVIKIPITFNDKEKKIITHLMTRYLARKRDKSLDQQTVSNKNLKDVQSKSSKINNGNHKSVSDDIPRELTEKTDSCLKKRSCYTEEHNTRCQETNELEQ